MNILILGPQGSGKGTQADLLAHKLGLFHFEIGNFLRQLAKENPEIDEKVNKKGELLEDREIFLLVTNFLDFKKMRNNIIFDGYPRSITQFNLLKSWLDKKGRKVDLGIFIDISRDESIKRLTSRRIDRKTGKVYNLVTNPPGPEVKAEDLIQRQDDREEAIKERLNEYEKATEPLRGVLRKEGILLEVNGERSISEIGDEVLTAVRERLEDERSKD
ncbi:MAG: Adenylate kinase [Candidatus Woesebacteria bacterium GW2011_GWC1_43_10b]|uniref:Adenylate kinase n=1 Tax=Candidatus Woesebacteria bacterium GW2011_GWC1_43_10b TaxID=1618585 RepID=A0A0G1C629_9BACT|nr:MAG: Adenylate kinase [Candidatus Woesebacteria bacterium GW2011_GWC1_43_10b]